LLAELAVTEVDWCMLHTCDCTHGPCDNIPESDICGERLDLCPYAMLRDPYFQIATYLIGCQDVQPLEGWPTKYSAGIVTAVRAIRHARNRQAARSKQTVEV
jgi:hypothetical protein